MCPGLCAQEGRREGEGERRTRIGGREKRRERRREVIEGKENHRNASEDDTVVE